MVAYNTLIKSHARGWAGNQTETNRGLRADHDRNIKEKTQQLEHNNKQKKITKSPQPYLILPEQNLFFWLVRQKSRRGIAMFGGDGGDQSGTKSHFLQHSDLPCGIQRVDPLFFVQAVAFGSCSFELFFFTDFIICEIVPCFLNCIPRG